LILLGRKEGRGGGTLFKLLVAHFFQPSVNTNSEESVLLQGEGKRGSKEKRKLGVLRHLQANSGLKCLLGRKRGNMKRCSGKGRKNGRVGFLFCCRGSIGRDAVEEKTL